MYDDDEEDAKTDNGNYGGKEMSHEELRYLQQRYKPNNEPTGHYTGRCARCGSADLWDDCTAYGCNTCKAIYFTG